MFLQGALLTMLEDINLNSIVNSLVGVSKWQVGRPDNQSTLKDGG